MKKIRFLLPACLAFVSGSVLAQTMDSASLSNIKVSTGYLKRVQQRAADMDKRIAKQTADYLASFQKEENSLQKAVYAKDSLKAKELFSGSQQKYIQLLSSLHASLGSAQLPALKEYLPAVDSMETAMRFLSKAGAGNAAWPTSKLSSVESTATQLQQLEGRWQQARDVESYIKQRESDLKQQLAEYGVGKQLLGMNKQAFYLQQQMTQYKAMLQDKQLMQAKLLNTLRETPAFQGFMQKHSYLGRLFSLPDNYGTNLDLPGLQTKAKVQDMISQQIGVKSSNGMAGPDPAQYAQQKVGQAEQQISELKNKLSVLGGSGGSGDVTVPDFKPNGERTKSFMQRVVVGMSLQTQPSTVLLPATANLALTLGYKIRSNVIAGVGAGYRLGVGNGINHISFSSQGVNLRSYLDVKIKGGWWMTGGMEYNYMQEFTKWQSLLQPDIWQKSALVGLEKKYRAGKRTGNLQILFDALYNQNTPKSQPIVFRTGIEF